MILSNEMLENAGMLLHYVSNSYANTISDVSVLLGISERDVAVIVRYLIENKRIELVGDKLKVIRIK